MFFKTIFSQEGDDMAQKYNIVSVPEDIISE